mmetsp:Transcript_21173/g.44992  ORF Transcript_21173/g.44992 Transcript_21173/m.44992 type:complete len:270 (+) Transcript_21173:538-1347(+)
MEAERCVWYIRRLITLHPALALHREGHVLHRRAHDRSAHLSACWQCLRERSSLLGAANCSGCRVRRCARRAPPPAQLACSHRGIWLAAAVRAAAACGQHLERSLRADAITTETEPTEHLRHATASPTRLSYGLRVRVVAVGQLITDTHAVVQIGGSVVAAPLQLRLDLRLCTAGLRRDAARLRHDIAGLRLDTARLPIVDRAVVLVVRLIINCRVEHLFPCFLSHGDVCVRVRVPRHHILVRMNLRTLALYDIVLGGRGVMLRPRTFGE